MAHWAVVFPADRFEEERLFANESLRLPEPADASPVPGPQPGDVVLLVADIEEPLLFGLGRMRADDSPDGSPVVAYTHRLIDEPLPAGGLKLGGPGVYPLEPSVFAASADEIDPYRRVDGPKRTWLVSVDLPIEAASPAEAARLFWSYVYELGPKELPAFVTPTGNELAMQAFVLGAEANQDPEED
jgi:hypothetical protein